MFAQILQALTLALHRLLARVVQKLGLRDVAKLSERSLEEVIKIEWFLARSALLVKLLLFRPFIIIVQLKRGLLNRSPFLHGLFA